MTSKQIHAQGKSVGEIHKQLRDIIATFAWQDLVMSVAVVLVVLRVLLVCVFDGKVQVHLCNGPRVDSGRCMMILTALDRLRPESRLRK